MCGIAGVLRVGSDGAVSAALLHAMNAAQAHRGPDGANVHVGSRVGLAHLRLSIIDRAGSDQPMYNEDGQVVVVYNGEIYNFREVREELIALGHQFKTEGDTEIIVHGWEQWGAACLERFRGMFAFAVWDATNRTLMLARDRLGIKPLYYTLVNNDELVFASELKALLEHPGVARELDRQALDNYFALGYIPEPKTILNNVSKLEAGHYLIAKLDQALPASRPYWAFQIDPSAVTGSDTDLAAELRERIDEAVQIRLVSEVPLGAFLSGGIDSSAIVASMAGASERAVNTCSIGFSDPRFNETEYAQEMATRYATDHFTREVNPDDFELIDRLGRVYDEPFADPSAIPTYRLCQLARERVTVALSGDGGDEMLAGYTRYKFHMAEERLRGVLPLALRKPLFGGLGRLYPKADWAPKMLRARSTFQSLSKPSAQAYFNTVSLMNDETRAQMFSARVKSDLQDYTTMDVFDAHLRSHGGALDPLSMAQYLDVKTYLSGDILTKVDRASMAHSLEVRVPLLDFKLVEWMGKLPVDCKLRGSEGKFLLKKAMEPRVPSDLLYRRKMGFSVPLASWFRGPLKQRVRDTILDGQLSDSGLFDQANLRKLVQQHESGIRDNNEYLWALLMFDASMTTLGISA